MITVMQTRFELDQRGYHPSTDPSFSPTRMGNMHEQHRRDMPPPRMTSSRDMPLRTSSYVRAAERPKRPLGPPPGFEPFRPPPGYEDFTPEEFQRLSDYVDRLCSDILGSDGEQSPCGHHPSLLLGNYLRSPEPGATDASPLKVRYFETLDTANEVCLSRANNSSGMWSG